MAHDWLGDLFRRWGMTPAGRTPRRPRIAVERLEARDVPAVNPVFAILADPTPAPAAVGTDPFRPGPELTASTTEVFVSVRGADPTAVLAGLLATPGNPGFDLSRTLPFLVNGAEGMFQVGLAAGTPPEAAIGWFAGRAGVQWASPNYYTQTDPRLFTPNDPLYTQQYHLTKIQAHKAWDITTGSPNVIIAITDDGVLDSHPDLSAAMWVNPSPTNGDKFGITAFVDPSSAKYGFSQPAPGDSHGNHVAGIAAAVTDNNTGVAGIAGGKAGSPGSPIMAIRTYGPDLGRGLYGSSIAKSMIYATDNGAKVINSSFVTSNFVDGAGAVDPVLRTAFDYLYGKGVIHVIAAGNDNSPNTANMQYSHGLIVASTDQFDRKSDFSNYGEGVDIAAPGTDILATWVRGADGVNADYLAISGTSMAAPVVSGVAALIWSANPTWTRDQVVTQLLATADSTSFYANNPSFTDKLGSGRVNAFRGVSETLPAPKFGATPGLPAEGKTVTGLSAFTLRTPHRLNPNDVQVTDFELRGAGSDGQFGTADDVLVPLTLNNNLPYRIGTNGLTFTFPALGPGQFRFTAFAAKITDPFGKTLDGNGDGVSGDDFVRTFTAAPAVSGTVFEDYNGTGAVDANAVGAGGMLVFLDKNGNGKRDGGEPFTFAGLGGRFSFPNAQFPTIAAGDYTVRVDVPTGWAGTGATPVGIPITFAKGDTLAGLNFGLARVGAVYGTVFNDADGDGKRAVNDPGVPGFTVFLDADGDGKFTAPTKTAVSKGSNPAQVNIPDNGIAGSPITITSGTGKITNVRLTVTADSSLDFGGGIAPGYLFNLTLTLVGPDGTRVPLAGYLDNAFSMINTVLDSTAAASVRSGTGTLTGVFRPTGDLSVFNGLSPLGTWVLEGLDNQINGAEPFFTSVSVIRNWSLQLTTGDGDQQVVTGGTGGYRFDTAAGEYGLTLVRQAGFALTTPQAGYGVSVDTSAGGAIAPNSFGLRRDTIAPRLISFAPVGPAVTNSKVLTFAARFSEPIEGLSAGNFDLAAFNLPGAKVESLAATATPGLYTLVVSNPGGFGTVAVSLPAAASKLTDFALNPLIGAPANADIVTVDTLLPTSTLTLPASPGGKNVYTSAAWPGALTGTAVDAETGVAEVFVTIRQDATGLYFDGTSFSSPDPLPVTANVAGGTWSLALSAGVLPEGPYTVSQEAVDFAANVQAETNVATFGIDNGPPTVAISPAAGALVNTNPIPFVLTFSEPVTGNLAANLSVTGGALLGVSGSGASYTAVVRPNGSGPVSIALAAGAAQDFAGNTSGAASAAVVFDGTAPTVALSPGVDGQAVTSGNFAGVITGTAGDDLSGVAKVQVAVRRRVGGVDTYFDGTGFAAGSPVYAAASGTNSWSYSFPAANFPADDAYQFLVRVTDAAGNPTVVPVNVTIDNLAPVPAVATPAAGALVNAASFEQGGLRVGGTAADATSGPAATAVAVQRQGDGFYFDGTTFVASATPVFVPAGGTASAWTLPTLTADRLIDGRYQVTVRTTDRAGNVGTATTAFTFDNTAPVPINLRPANGIGYNAAGWPGTISGGVADSDDTAGVQVSILRQADGTYWNGSFFGSTAPLFLDASFSRPVPLGGPDLPVPPLPVGTTFSYPFSAFGFPSEGVYTLTVVATDKAGSQATAVSTFSFDNTTPTSTVTPLGTGAVFSPATFPNALTGTAADTLSGVGLVQVSLRQVSTGRYFDGAGFASSTETKLAATLATPNGLGTGWSFALPAGALPADGQYLVNAYASDVAGNVQAFGTPYTFSFDATPPQAVVQTDKGAVTNVAPLSFTVGFTSPVSDLDPTGLAVTNGTVLDVARLSDSTFVVRVTPAGDGAVGLSVLPTAAADAAGNPTLPAGPAVGQFDRTAPTVALTAPTGVLPLGEPVTVTATFSEPVVGFGPGSLTATNATILGVSGSGAKFQIQLLPNGPGPVGLSIAPGAFADAAGNVGAASVSITRSAEDPRYAVSVGNVVRAYDNRNGLRGQAAPFGDGYTGSIRVASADFNADGIPDIVAATGPGVPARVVVLDGKTFGVLFEVSPFEESFTGGVFVAVGDLTGDGVAELVITPDEGGGPRVRVFDGVSFAQVADFFGIADSAFRGGARAAVGDINGDGIGDLIVAAGFGGGPRVAVFDGTTISKGEGNLQRVVGDFFAYEETLRNGVYVAAGDLDGDGVAELVTAGGPGGGPRVTAFSGSELAAGRLARTVDFFSGDPESRDGVRVAVKKMTVSEPAQLVVGGGSTNRLAVYTAAGLRQSPPATSFEQDLLPGVSGGGVFVG